LRKSRNGKPSWIASVVFRSRMPANFQRFRLMSAPQRSGRSKRAEDQPPDVRFGFKSCHGAFKFGCESLARPLWATSGHSLHLRTENCVTNRDIETCYRSR
jgi:hypothetical protein